MSAQLERDLGAWASGDLDRERLLATHGSAAAGVVALHERLAGMATAIPIPDAEAGWASLRARLVAPAPVVPLRRHAGRRRTVPLLVAAALVAAGAAFAAVWDSAHHPAPTAPTAPIATTIPGGSEVFGPGDRRLEPPPGPGTVSAGHHGGSGSALARQTSTGTTGSAGDASGVSPSTDDPQDRDHGTGNDGSHDDNGSGNDGRSGTLPHGSHGQGSH